MVLKWYAASMSGTYAVVMGDRGRLVVPAELRERMHIEAGSALVMFETPDGVVLATRDQLKNLVRRELRGLDLVQDLLAERRKVAAGEDTP